MWSEHRFLAFDGTPIFYRRLRAPGARAGLLIVHGMGEHGGRYRHVAEYFAAMGFECFVPDLRGFGKSGGPRAFAERSSDFHADLEALHALAARETGLPFFLVGHSFGGLLTASYAALRKTPSPLKGIVLSSPIFGIAVPVPAWRRWLGIALARVLPRHSEKSGVRPEMLTRDRVMLENYGKDELIHHRITTRLYAELVGLMARRSAIASRLTLPVLIVASGRDEVVDFAMAKRFFDEIASSDKSFEAYPEGYHELFNDLGRDAVFARIGTWLIERLSK